MNGSKTSKYILSRLYELPILLTEPSSRIEPGGPTIKARFLSFALLVLCVVFPILQATSDIASAVPIYTLMTFVTAGLYLLSRGKYTEIAAKVAIVCIAAVPVLFFLSTPEWNFRCVLFMVLMWPVIAAILGSQLLPLKEEAALIFGMTTILVIATIIHPGIGWIMAAEPISISISISILVLLGTWTLLFYIGQLEKKNQDLAEKQTELKTFASILTHDLGNDLQVILSEIELSNLLLPLEKDQVEERLRAALAASERMSSLIKLLAAPQPDRRVGFVSLLENVAQQAEKTYKNLKINITAEEEIGSFGVTSNLIGPVFTNLFRNASQHCGSSPVVDIHISKRNGQFLVIAEDNGPGIPENLKEQVFERGFTTRDATGMGLYLSKKILELLGGQISLDEKQEGIGCRFRILIPADLVAVVERRYSRILREEIR
ncbi:MAG: sensor histidine kinase [Candidatus Hodarchaeota archaeon]